MCGICGFVTKRKITYDMLKNMNDTMKHRGPNDSGERIYEMSQNLLVGMAHRRLSILDLSDLGHQPMESSDKGVSVVFNGEIYNHLDLRAELKDYPFCSSCDTEVILASYLKWGIDCVKRFNGMFAMAVLDRRREEIYLARDRIGKKPLYYYWNQGELVFASELKPVMAYPYFEKKIRTGIIPRFLCQQYINAPDTVYENTCKLEPGAVLCYQNGSIKTFKFWDTASVYHQQIKSPVQDYGQAKAELRKLLEDAVKIRMMADVPVGLFLSGGYDSSLVTAIAQSLSEKPVHTYAIGFGDESFDEACYAKQVAEELGTIHTEHYISEQEMLALVDSIPKYYDEPFADSSQIPGMLVADVAKNDVTVVLTGDGGDEFFCGYSIYDLVKQAQMLDVPGRMVYAICNFSQFKRIGLINRLPFKIRAIVQNNDSSTKTQFVMSSHYIQMANDMVMGKKKTVLYPEEMKYEENSWQKRRMLLDMDTYLPGDILCKVDRATMKYSMEARCPLLDYRVMEYSYRLPHRFKFWRGKKKRILKDLAYEFIPRSLLDRPKKGFGVPLDSWMRGPLKEQLLDYSNKEYVERQGIFDARVIEKTVSDYIVSGDGGAYSGRNFSKILWSYLCFQKWYQNYS